MDELHHLFIKADGMQTPDEITEAEVQRWFSAVVPVQAAATYMLGMSGTLRRSEAGQKVPFVEFDEDRNAKVDIRYTRRQAIEEKAILPLRVVCSNGRACWQYGDHPASDVILNEAKTRKDRRRTRSILCEDKAMIWGVFEDAYEDWRYHQQERYESKMIVLCETTALARWMAQKIAQETGKKVVLAVSQDGDKAKKAIRQFRDGGDVHILVSVNMAYEGLDVPTVTHLVCLRKIRTTIWLEQVFARAVRPIANLPGWPVEKQEAVVFILDDQDISNFLDTLMLEQADSFTERRPLKLLRAAGQAKRQTEVLETEKLESATVDPETGRVSPNTERELEENRRRHDWFRNMPLNQQLQALCWKKGA